MNKNSNTAVYFCKSTKGHHTDVQSFEHVPTNNGFITASVARSYPDVSVFYVDRFTSSIKEKIRTRIAITGGPSGNLKSCLKLASSGNKVHLTENIGACGGHRDSFIKAFNASDCEAGIQTSKMVMLKHHLNIAISF
jgi:heterodisulfide reductase subunit A-like polyferredoxin